jgi:hypothetical protein
MLLVARMAGFAEGNAMKAILGLVMFMWICVAQAQMRPPAFAGGVPGMAQTRAMLLQRHQARALLYREALEELRKNPAAADLPACTSGPRSGACLAIDPLASAAAAPPTPTSAGTGATTGRRIALLMGNNDYESPIPPLQTPVGDIAKIAEVLEDRFGFDTRVLVNIGQESLIEAINRVAAEARFEDTVLLVYAGHGYLLEDIGMGFWIPADAKVTTAKGWVSNQDIAKLLSAIRAKQLMLISDSCYSGTLTKEMKPETEKAWETQRRAVVVLSSGGDEPVSDEGKEGHSIFAWNLIKTLQNTGSITPGGVVWTKVRKGISEEFSQEPQYGAVVSAGHVVGSEFLFQPK